jgi:hypothetical protein
MAQQFREGQEVEVNMSDAPWQPATYVRYDEGRKKHWFRLPRQQRAWWVSDYDIREMEVR